MTNERKRALVTGGSSGIGFGTAQGLIGAGYRVTLIARNADRLRDAAAELGSQADWRCADVGKREQVQKALLGMERVDVLVNAAGFLRPVSLATPLEEAEANWDGVIEGNLKGSFLMAHAVAPLLASPGGRIINISSIGAQTGGSRPGAVAYAAAKSGLHGLTYALCA
jgi:3-oxoacyl-[acyl-carrier protein] reductase